MLYQKLIAKVKLLRQWITTGTKQEPQPKSSFASMIPPPPLYQMGTSISHSTGPPGWKKCSHFLFHLCFVHPLKDVALHQCLLLSVYCFTVPGGSLLCYLVCHILLGHPLNLLPLLGYHYVQHLLLLMSSIPAICPANFHRLVGLVVKASASRAEGPGFESRLRRDFFRGRVIPVTSKLALQWLPCQVPGVIGSALGLVGPVSVYCDWVR